MTRYLSDTKEQSEERERYVDLSKNRNEHKTMGTESAAYTTGACVWKTIVDKYGHNSFKQIMKKVEESRYVSMSFVDDILVPVIKQEGIDTLKDKFGNDSIEEYR